MHPVSAPTHRGSSAIDMGHSHSPSVLESEAAQVWAFRCDSAVRALCPVFSCSHPSNLSVCWAADRQAVGIHAPIARSVRIASAALRCEYIGTSCSQWFTCACAPCASPWWCCLVHIGHSDRMVRVSPLVHSVHVNDASAFHLFLMGRVWRPRLFFTLTSNAAGLVPSHHFSSFRFRPSFLVSSLAVAGFVPRAYMHADSPVHTEAVQ